VTVLLEVFLLDPLPDLVPVTSPARAPHHLEDPMIHIRKSALARRTTVIHGPTIDLLIQAPDHISCRQAARAVDRFLNLGQVFTFREDGLVNTLPQRWRRTFCPKKSKPSSTCVIWVFSWESSKKLASLVSASIIVDLPGLTIGWISAPTNAIACASWPPAAETRPCSVSSDGSFAPSWTALCPGGQT
jgi:hypothetical protein